MLALVPPVAVGAVVVGRKMSKIAREAQDALARANEAAEEVIAGIRTVRSKPSDRVWAFCRMMPGCCLAWQVFISVRENWMRRPTSISRA